MTIDKKERILQLTKDQLHKLKYPKKDVLKTDEARRKRAVALQNINRTIMTTLRKITFESIFHGKLCVEVPVIMSGERYIIVKGGDMIPVHSIHRIEH